MRITAIFKIAIMSTKLLKLFKTDDLIFFWRKYANKSKGKYKGAKATSEKAC